MKKICLVCPTILLKRPIVEIIKKIECDDLGLLFPIEGFKGIDKNLPFKKIKNIKIYSYPIIRPPFLSSEFPIPINPKFFINLIRILKRYDVINMWVPFYISNTTIAILKKVFFPNKKLILTMDTIPIYSFRMGKLFELIFRIYYKTLGKIVFSASNNITLYGESMKKYAFMAGILPDKIKITPTGIDLNIKKRDRDIRKEFKINEDKNIILFIGLLNLRKGIDIIIKTIKQLKDQNIKVLLVGEGTKRKYYQRMVKKNKLQDIIIFTGFRKDIHNFYHEADIFFFPSRGEGLAGVIMESMLYSVPIIASNIPGTRDLIKNNENGYLCNKDDIDCFAKKILKLLEDKRLREKFIKNAKEKIEKNHSWEKNIKYFTRLYE